MDKNEQAFSDSNNYARFLRDSRLTRPVFTDFEKSHEQSVPIFINTYHMKENSINRLQFLCETIPGLLEKLDDISFCEKENLGKWSKKEIIGHLIDSATNNHHRFIRGQFEECPEIVYDQNKWNEFGFYQKIDRKQIIAFWKLYNQQLVELIKQIPTENMKKQIRIGEDKVTLEFLMDDYVAHLEHHLRQVVTY